MKSRGLLLLAVVALATLARPAAAQPTNLWRAFTRADGLAENACVSVGFGASGNVLVRHARSSAISILYGYDIKTFPGSATNRSRVYESSAGQLWAVAGDGLLEFREGEWTLHRVAAIAEHFRNGRTNEIALLPVRQGRVLILLPDQLLQLDAEDPERPQVKLLRQADQTQLGAFTAISLARDGGLRISGTHGYARIAGPLRNLNSESEWTERIPPAELRIQGFRNVLEDDHAVVWAFVDSAGARGKSLVSFDGRVWMTCGLGVENIQFAWRAPGAVWFATSDAVLELEDARTNATVHEEIYVRRIFDVAVEPGGAFWLATSDGLFRHAPAIWQAPQRQSPDQPEPLAPPMARTNQAIKIPTGLPDEIARLTEWKCALIAKNGDVWLGGTNRIAWQHQNSWRLFSSTNQIGPEEVSAFAEAPDGRICCATPNRVWEFDGKNWLALRGGLERVNGLLFARDGTLWVATDRGAHRYWQGTWIANGIEDGLPSEVVRAISEDERGQLWATTARGVRVFRPEADNDPPRTIIRQPDTAEPRFREGVPVTLRFDGRDKWKLTAADRLLFSYRLDEREWSPFHELGEMSFAELALGKHYFQVRAMDRNGNIDPKPDRLEFAVVVPWYRETRLVLILTVALAVAIFFAALAFNRHRRLQHSYAEVERQVAERTRELELANRELLHSQKMNALGTLAAGIAHDFNNILSIIKGSAQIIEDNPDNPEKVRTRLDRIKMVVQQGAGIVEAMLGFSRASDQQTGTCDLNAVVDDTVKLLGDRFLREVEVRFDPGEALPELPVARDFVQQVLLNFIFNAAEAMERRSPDRPALGAAPPRKQIVIAARQLAALPAGMVLLPGKAESFVVISVRDFGSGITPEDLPRIFEPFFTTKAMSARRGTGLGLSMVYELAKKMGAGLAVESTAGAGSTFTLILPARQTPTDSKPEDSVQHVRAS